MIGYVHGHATRSQAIASKVNASCHPHVVQNKYDPGRATRANQNPVCTHFSKMRRAIYPDAFFCTNCEWWEREVDVCNKRVNRQSKTYSCKAKHYSWVVPRPLWTVPKNRPMLSKEEVEAISLLEESKRKTNQQKDNECVTTDDETICTVDEEDVEDNGSICEDGAMIEAEHDSQKHYIDGAHDVCEDNTMIEVERESKNDCVDEGTPTLQANDICEGYNDNNNNSMDTDVSPPSKKRNMSYKDDIDDLKLKYQQLLQKTENYRKTAAYWKSRHNQTVQSEVTAL